MKRLLTYNESIRDKMTPKDRDGIRNELSKLPVEKLLWSSLNNKLELSDYFSNEEIKEKLLKLPLKYLIYQFGESNLHKYFSDAEIKDMNEELDGILKLESTLLEGARSGSLNFVRNAIEDGVDINIMDSDGNTALYNAAYNGHLDVVKCLVENEAKIDIQCGRDKRSPLLIAVGRDRLDVVKYLVEQGANMYFRDIQGRDAFDTAKIWDRNEILNYLNSQNNEKQEYDDIIKLKNSGDFVHNLRNMIINKANNLTADDYPGSDKVMKTFINEMDDKLFYDTVKKTISKYDH